MQEEAEEENLEVITVIPGKCISEHGVEQTVELAESSGKEAGSSWVEKYDTTSTTSTAVAKSVGEAQPLGIAWNSASTEFSLAESSGEARSFGPRAKSMTRTAANTVEKSVGETLSPASA